MKFTVSLRIKNPAAKFPVESIDRDDFAQALVAANKISNQAGRDHFVEITNEVGEVLAKFHGAQ